MRRAAMIGLCSLALVTTGCLGSVSPAVIPASAQQQHGWEEVAQNKDSFAGGLGEAVLIDYAPSGRTASAGGVTVATTNDVPLFDEARLIPRAIERLEERHGVDFQETGERAFQLTNHGTTVTATEYDVEGGPGDGKALVFEVDCDDFVVVAAWGSTHTGGLFGDDTSPYQDALELAAAVTC